MLGHPVSVELEQIIEETVPRSEHDDLVAAIERFMRLEGTTLETPGGLVWRYGGRFGETLVELISWRGGTKIQLVGRFWDTLVWILVGAALIGWMPGLVVVAALELGPAPGAAVFAAGYLATYLGVRVLWHGIGREQERGLMALLERVIEHAQMTEETTGSEGGRGATRRQTVPDMLDPTRGAKRNTPLGADVPLPRPGDGLANEM